MGYLFIKMGSTVHVHIPGYMEMYVHVFIYLGACVYNYIVYTVQNEKITCRLSVSNALYTEIWASM